MPRSVHAWNFNDYREKRFPGMNTLVHRSWTDDSAIDRAKPQLRGPKPARFKPSWISGRILDRIQRWLEHYPRPWGEAPSGCALEGCSNQRYIDGLPQFYQGFGLISNASLYYLFLLGSLVASGAAILSPQCSSWTGQPAGGRPRAGERESGGQRERRLSREKER